MRNLKGMMQGLVPAALLLALPAAAQAPIRSVNLGQAGGHVLEYLQYASGASRCQAGTSSRWTDGAAGRSGAEIHFDGSGASEVTYYISKSSWSMRDGARTQGELRFSTGPAYRVSVDAVGGTMLRMTAPHASFPHWREATRATLSLDNGFSAWWSLGGTNAAGQALLRCVDAVAGQGRREDPMAPRRADPMAPRATDPMAPRGGGGVGGGRDDSWISKN